MSKHTPGPWLINKDGDIAYRSKDDDQSYGFEITIADMRPWDEPYALEQRANARLIAKAPEIFEVLREIVTQWDCDEIGRIDGDVIGRAEKLLEGK